MRCQQATELMSLALDGLLDEEGRQTLEAHFAICVLCQRTWAAMQQLSTFLSAAPMIGPSPGFATRVTERIVRQQKRRQLVAGYTVLVVGILLLLALPIAYMAGSVSIAGGAVTQEPGFWSQTLAILTRLSGIAYDFLRVCWVVLKVLPESAVRSAALIAALLVAFWFQVVSGRSGIVRERMRARSR